VTTNDERPAFPQPQMNTIPGMTLREYFAAAALTGLMSGGTQGNLPADEIADNALKLADAMIARSKE
jgi:hypothetical protein